MIGRSARSSMRMASKLRGSVRRSVSAILTGYVDKREAPPVEFRVRRHTLANGDEARSRPRNDVYAAQFAALEKAESPVKPVSPPKPVDPRIEFLRKDIQQTRLELAARNSGDEIVDVATLKSQIYQTTQQLHASARMAKSLNLWTRRAQKTVAARAANHAGVRIEM